MQRRIWRMYLGLLLASGCQGQTGTPQRALTWQETQERFKANNPTLLAGQMSIDESRADEITAYLRPNPDLTLTTDGTQISPSGGVWRPFAGTLFTPSVSYLHERQHKRELRLASAQRATEISISAQSDLQRNLTFNLRDAFVRVLQAKAVLGVAKRISNITTKKSQSIETDSNSAILRKWISSAWSYSASNSNRTCKLRW